MRIHMSVDDCKKRNCKPVGRKQYSNLLVRATKGVKFIHNLADRLARIGSQGQRLTRMKTGKLTSGNVGN